MQKVAVVDINKIDVSELKQKLSMKKIEVGYLSDSGFCPYLISFYNAQDDCTVVCNYNSGYIKRLREIVDIVECEDMDDFIYETISINETKNNNTLF